MLDQRDLFGNPIRTGLPMLDKYRIPPFSVFDARQGYWQERKAQWLRLGLESGNGRGTNVLNYTGAYGLYHYYDGDEEEQRRAGTSIFDPVLCEFLYRWYCPQGGTVLDPFAGGSVRGIVAAHLGAEYHGVDLRPEQVDANYMNALAVCEVASCPAWYVGDSRRLEDVLPSEVRADLLFSCPPYYNLERYSTDPLDLSNAPSYSEFLASYRRILSAAAARLRSNRFACFVVGDFREDGALRLLSRDTIAAFEAAGLVLYTSAIYVTPVGTMPIRAGAMFRASRKLCPGHQHVLVFLKGDARRAAEAVRWPEDKTGDGAA